MNEETITFPVKTYRSGTNGATVKPVRNYILAKYKTYRRANRNDLLTMVELSEIKNNCKHFIWQK